MRIRFRVPSALGLGTGIVALLASGAARAQQVDTNPPLPNVLLLVDNSGSMELMIDGNTPEADGSACNCTDNGPGTAPTCNFTTLPGAMNRWNTLASSLSGSLQNGFSCVAMPRTAGATTFQTEYQIAGQQPYDINYFLPYHRIVAQDPTATGATVAKPAACVLAPGALNGAQAGQGVGPLGSAITGNATDFSGTCSSGVCSGSIVSREYGLLSNPITCTFAQNSDGALTQMKDLMRFGLMTFDSDTGAGVGVTTSGNPQVSSAPFAGMWTYYPGWNTGAANNEYGNPVDCATNTTLAVGARNPGAPAWEGRMVGFPSSNAITAQETNNAEISEVLEASRPYGATPMAGMFAGAEYYYWNDPTGPQQTDPYVQGGCRPQFIILLTDGAPNLDLQPTCSATDTSGSGRNGTCPYPTPQAVAKTLYDNGQSVSGKASVETFVIGFAVSGNGSGSSGSGSGTSFVDCSQFSQSGTLAGECSALGSVSGTGCNDPNLPNEYYPPGSSATTPGATFIGPCCELQCIAQAGGSKQAYFADTQGDLQNALGTILAQISQNATTRTTPSYAPAATNVVSNPNTPATNAEVFLSSFTPTAGGPWSGDVQRQRYQCSFQGGNYNVTPPTIQPSLGDDFAQNLDSHAGPARVFVAVQAAANSSGVVDSTAMLRPYAASSVGDGMGTQNASTYAGAAAAVVPSITPAALNIPTKGCAYVSNVLGGGQKYLTQAQCTSMLLDYTFGQSSFSGGPSDFTFVSRYNDALGDIYHATPVVVGPPGSLLQDPTYVQFRNTWATRQQVAYVATNDGLLHAFWTDVGSLQNNELWAMLMPEAMTSLQSSYPSSHEFLLDGSPVVKDVVWDRNQTATATVWHTMLVAGYGPSEQGYYAVDVTNPATTGMTSGSVPTDPPPAGPVFRWQLTKMPSTNYPLFGAQSATPAITTLFFDPGDGGGARDIGVAILPGGQNSAPTSSSSSGSSCARAVKSTDSAPLNAYTARSAVRCWGGSNPPQSTDYVIGRSLSVVRLDTGEIVRTFARKADASTTWPNDTLLAKGRIIDTPLDSPMTGTPIVYPSDVGTDATKVFIGDADGTLWKFDLSNSNPSSWTGELYLDLYNTQVDTNSTTGWADGQPFQVDPVPSLDTSGELVLNAATGSIQTFDTTGVEYVYSVTEKVQGNPAKLRASVNWYLGPQSTGQATAGNYFQPGERVSGPMTVFNGTVYFSTYAAASQSATTCTSGHARLWGRDYVTPYSTTDPSQGGLWEFPAPPATPAANVEPDQTNTALAGIVIPGVSIMSTPACAGLGTAGADQYVAGATHQTPSNFSGGSYSLFTQLGTKGTNGAATQQYQQSLATPLAPTSIDSWAAVLE